MDNPLIISILLALVLLVGIVVGYLIRKSIAEAKISSAETLAKQIVDEANRNAEAAKKEALLEAKEENHKLRQQAENELREHRNEVQTQENRLIQKEENLDRRSETLDKRELLLEKREHSLAEQQQQIEEMESKVEAMLNEQQTELERISGYTTDQARQVILDRIEQDLAQERGLMIKEVEDSTKEFADKKTKNILTLAIRGCAADGVAKRRVWLVNLQNDEMKDRIMGRKAKKLR